MKSKPKIASRHTAPLRRMQRFAISLVIVLLSSVVIARDARFKRVDGHAIGFWAGSDSVDAIIAARDHDLHHREDAELIARADDDDDNDNDNDESKKPDDSQKDTNDGVGDDKNDVGQQKGDGDKNDGRKDNKQDEKNDEHKDAPKKDAPKDQNDNKNDDQKNTPNNDQKDDKDDQKYAPKDDQQENKDDHQDSPKPNDDQKEVENNQPDDDDKKNNPNQETKTEEEKQQPTETKSADDKDSTTDAAPKTTDSPKTTDQPQPTTTEDDNKTTKAPETTKTKDADATKTTTKVRVTVSTESNGDATTIDLPTLYPGGITALPKAQVPPTANAPYRQSSKYPEGFIFIIVGSIIGFAFACVLLWNAIIAWSLNRSVRRTAGSRPAGSSATGDNETDPMMFPFRRRGASTSKGAATESTRPKRGRGRSTSPYADVPLARGPMVETRSRRDTTDAVSPLTVMPTSHARPHSHQRSQPMRHNNSSLYFSPTANPGAHDMGPRRQYDGGHFSAGYYPTTSRSNPAHSRHTSRSHLPPSPGKRTTSPGKRTTSPGKRSTGSGRQPQPGSASQGQIPSTQPLPLSAQHLHHLDMLSQEQQQQLQQQQQSSIQTPQQYPSPNIRNQYGGAAPAPGMLSPNSQVPVRGPSMLLDDMLGSGVSIAGSGPEARGYTNDGGNDNNAGRGERSRRGGRR